MPSVAPPPSRPAPPSDTALVQRSRQGDRGAFAVLFARHAGSVAERAAAHGLDAAATARVVRDVFRTAQRSLHAPAAAQDFPGWVRGLTMDRLAAGGRGPSLAPATAAAVRSAAGGNGPAVRDAVWRELERGWQRDRQTVWQRHGTGIAVTATVGGLLIAVLIVGLLVLDQVRPRAPVGAIELIAQPIEETETETEPPPVAPSVIVPPVVVEEPFVPPDDEPSEPAPAPSPEPSPDVSETPTEPAEPTEDPEPTESPTSEPPLLPLPGPSEGASEPGDAASDGSGDGSAGGSSDGSGGGSAGEGSGGSGG